MHTRLGVSAVMPWHSSARQSLPRPPLKRKTSPRRIVNNNVASGAGTVLIRSTAGQRGGAHELVGTLREKGPTRFSTPEDMRPSENPTPDSLGYDLRYAQQTPCEEGGGDRHCDACRSGSGSVSGRAQSTTPSP